MSTEAWFAEAKLRGEFTIPDQTLAASAEATQSVKRVEVTPEFDDADKYTGNHLLTVHLDIENPNDAPLAAEIPFEEGKEVAERIAALVSLSIGRPVHVVSVSVKHHLSDTRHRLIAGASQTAAIAPPSAFDPTVLTMDLDAKTRRIIRWWARGIAADDGLERLAASSTALDLLAGTLEDVPGRTRTCSNCGNEEHIGPGLKERVVTYLTRELDYDAQTAADIYDSRIDLAHGRSDLSEGDLRRFRRHADLVADAVRAGIGKRVGITLPDPPRQLPFDMPSALLDIEYQDPPAE